MKTIIRTLSLIVALLVTTFAGRDFSRTPVVVLAAAASCESLAALTLSNGNVTSATSLPAGAFAPPGGAGRGNAAQQYAALPAFCRVTATLKPTSDSDIRIEVWLPASGWNGKFQAVGCGAAMPRPAPTQDTPAAAATSHWGIPRSLSISDIAPFTR